MHCTVASLDDMTTEEFMGWLAYFKLREKAHRYNKSQD